LLTWNSSLPASKSFCHITITNWQTRLDWVSSSLLWVQLRIPIFSVEALHLFSSLLF
jgi:hypothetical protein